MTPNTAPSPPRQPTCSATEASPPPSTGPHPTITPAPRPADAAPLLAAAEAAASGARTGRTGAPSGGTAPVPSAPVPSAPVSAAPVSAVPEPSVPEPSAPVSAVPVSAVPEPSAPVPAVPEPSAPVPWALVPTASVPLPAARRTGAPHRPAAAAEPAAAPARRPAGPSRPLARPASPEPPRGPGPEDDETAGRPPYGPADTLRFAVLGDSLSEGVGDRVDGRWRGWGALLAERLGDAEHPVAFRNFAVSGALSQDVADDQTPRAAAFRPHVASVVVGVNDTLRRTFDIARLARNLDRACGELAAAGAVLLTACLPDPGRMLALPAPLARPLARRQQAVNTVVHALAARHRTLHLHLADPVWTSDRTLWSADRLHPGERGHRAIAARFHTLLAAEGLAHGAPPARDPQQPPPTTADVLLWLATSGTGWVLRRCNDLLPQLLLLAGGELRHWAQGTGARLDRHAENALSAALAAVSLDVPRARMGE
ncbi:GDSL-type esterase/lipase family protein [Streptomyces sp. HUAS MG47]|uniref:GDSL-type esterase/lipase family protein n=1 Tax=Streptomyces solicamelliae TaxID=3231716 RepID=UPI003877B119